MRPTDPDKVCTFQGRCTHLLWAAVGRGRRRREARQRQSQRERLSLRPCRGGAGAAWLFVDEAGRKGARVSAGALQIAAFLGAAQFGGLEGPGEGPLCCPPGPAQERLSCPNIILSHL
jgi:hypothetical protein